MKVEFNLIYAGKNVLPRKENGVKTGNNWYVYHFLEVDKKENVVRMLDSFCDSDKQVPENLELLKPCLVTLDISATSGRKELIDIKLNK